jgi:hypothetical protein
MEKMDTIDDMAMQDSGKKIISRFLSNASTWRGPDASRIKNELNVILKRKD